MVPQLLDGADAPGLAHISIPHHEGLGTIVRSTRTASTCPPSFVRSRGSLEVNYVVAIIIALEPDLYRPGFGIGGERTATPSVSNPRCCGAERERAEARTARIGFREAAPTTARSDGYRH